MQYLPSFTLLMFKWTCVTLSAAGMKHLRDNDVVHRDIKPGNIMRYITDDGRYNCVVFIDFLDVNLIWLTVNPLQIRTILQNLPYFRYYLIPDWIIADLLSVILTLLVHVQHGPKNWTIFISSSGWATSIARQKLCLWTRAAQITMIRADSDL